MFCARFGNMAGLGNMGGLGGMGNFGAPGGGLGQMPQGQPQLTQFTTTLPPIVNQMAAGAPANAATSQFPALTPQTFAAQRPQVPTAQPAAPSPGRPGGPGP